MVRQITINRTQAMECYLSNGSAQRRLRNLIRAMYCDADERDRSWYRRNHDHITMVSEDPKLVMLAFAVLSPRVHVKRAMTNAMEAIKLWKQVPRGPEAWTAMKPAGMINAHWDKLYRLLSKPSEQQKFMVDWIKTSCFYHNMLLLDTPRVTLDVWTLRGLGFADDSAMLIGKRKKLYQLVSNLFITVADGLDVHPSTVQAAQWCVSMRQNGRVTIPDVWSIEDE